MSSTKRGGIPPERVVKRLRSSKHENESPKTLPPEVWAGVMECKYVCNICISKIFMCTVIVFVYEMMLLILCCLLQNVLLLIHSLNYMLSFYLPIYYELISTIIYTNKSKI